jgi:DNA-binding response OmpR family regulator
MKKILVIEDEEQLRSDLVTIFGFEGYDAIGAENGRTGIQIAQQFLPDLIICDVNMPVLDGFGVITELRQDSKTAEIPIIFLSARNDRLTIEHGMQLGAAAYLRKPCDLSEVLDAVRAQIG